MVLLVTRRQGVIHPLSIAEIVQLRVGNVTWKLVGQDAPTSFRSPQLLVLFVMVKTCKEAVNVLFLQVIWR